MEHFLTVKCKNDSVLYITGETLTINRQRRPGNEISDNNNIQCVKSKKSTSITPLMYCTTYDQGQ